MSDVTAVSGGSAPANNAAKTATDKKAKTSFKETLDKVSGHRYAKVTDGERKGMYVNQSGNDRDAEAFKPVGGDGHEFHVYGEGKDRKVFELPAAAAAKPKS